MNTPPIRRPGDTPPPPASFLDGVLIHLQRFAATAGVVPNQVAVRLTLADGSSMAMNGLTSGPAASSGWGMIDGLGTDESEAVVLRESAVFKVEFALRTPAGRKPIGFESEVDPR